MIIAIIIEKIKYFSVNLWLVFSSEDKGCWGDMILSWY
jgi:hypothetical protein